MCYQNYLEFSSGHISTKVNNKYNNEGKVSFDQM